MALGGDVAGPGSRERSLLAGTEEEMLPNCSLDRESISLASSSFEIAKDGGVPFEEQFRDDNLAPLLLLLLPVLAVASAGPPSGPVVPASVSPSSSWSASLPLSSFCCSFPSGCWRAATSLRTSPTLPARDRI